MHILLTTFQISFVQLDLAFIFLKGFIFFSWNQDFLILKQAGIGGNIHNYLTESNEPQRPLRHCND